MPEVVMKVAIQKLTKSELCNFYDSNNKKIGYFVGFIAKDKKDNTFMNISKIEVYPKSRNKGYASEILREIYNYYKQNNGIEYMKPKGVYESAVGFWEKQYLNKNIPIHRCEDIIDGF